MKQDTVYVFLLSTIGSLAAYFYYNGGKMTFDIQMTGLSVLLFVGLIMMGVAFNQWMRNHFALRMLERVSDENNKKRIIDWYIGGTLKERLEIIEEIGSRVGGSEEE